MNLKDLTPPPPRMAPPVMVRVTELDREQLKQLADKYNLPMSRIAYFAIRQLLNEEFDRGGAQ
ncbi:hypothetical protein [Rappaport israeli]|uniref:hypothetical protein n=1 Tax=Rappaport israeli TaxID=1839807 RepID=UPI00093199C4|nr:hypothetical protein [Rappaport israeli]